MSLKASLSSAEVLKNSASIISDIIDEAVFNFNSNGLSVISPDRNMVAVIDFQLLSSAFDQYSVEGEVKVGLNLPNLVSILKRVKGTDKLDLEMADNRLLITVSSEGSRTRKFEIPILDINREKPPIDQLSFSGKIDLESAILEEGIEDASVVGESITFEADSNSFSISSSGDTSSSKLELKKGDSGLLSLEANDSVKSKYQIEYMKKIAKACKLSKQVTLEFGTDYPLRLAFKEIDKVNLNFVLAPLSDD